MLQLHTIYLISLISQATTSLVLSLLARADRRARWLVPLAVACGLHAAAIFLVPLWRGRGLWLPHAFSASILILMLYLIHLGFQALIRPDQRRSGWVDTAVGATMLVLFGLAYSSPLGCIEASEVAAVALMAWTIPMLWKGSVPELRGPLRATALLLFAFAVLFLVRLPLERTPTSHTLLLLRQATVLVVTSLAFSFLATYVAESLRRLHHESRLDSLTGLPNRRAMEENAADQLNMAARQARPCALLMLDIDHFKRLNDTWGHEAGDQALLVTGEFLLRTAREIGDSSVARIGGEEFALLLCNANVAAAHALAEQVREGIATLRIAVQQEQIGFTASVGISASRAGETNWLAMLRRADSAMYKAKREGRNRVTLCTEALDETLEEDASSDVLMRSN